MTTILILVIAASNVVVDIDCDINSLITEQLAEYTKIRLPGYELSDEVGAPEVPVRAIKVALPYGAKITGIEVLLKYSKELDDTFTIPYAQYPVILSQREIRKFAEPNEDIYSSDEPYPRNIIKLTGTSVYDNCQICELLFYPIQYLALSRKVMFHNSIRFIVKYEGGFKRKAHGDILKKLVVNPEDVIVDFDNRDREYFEYLIITNPPMDTVFQRLADWKTKKGIKTELRTVDWIVANYSGEDNAARIRNYIKTLPDSSTAYVLLAGDTDVIPHRRAFAMCCEYGGHSREDSLPCDLYFVDLQGTWDRNNNNVYGEIADSIDLNPDLFVGRAPVNTIAEAQKFVEKVLIYEKNPDLSYLDNALFAGDILWSNPYTDQGIHKDKIEAESFPPWFSITKLYDSQGTLTPTAVKNALRQGQGLSNHDGHGWIDVMSAGTGYLRRADFDTLTNAPKYGIWISIGCWTTAFDYNAIAESYVNSPNGGGVAFIGNSSYGWGSPGNPGFGYSDRFDSRYFYSLLKENNFHIGAAVALSKAHFVPFSREENVYRWHQYQLNLLGDPEMPVWTEIPETLSIAYPQSIPLGSSRILVTVKSKSNNTPIKDALVCLMKGTESYASGYTDASGSIFLNTTPSTAGNIDLTVSAHNYLPIETTIPVVSGSYVDFLGWIIDDASGNNDGIANPNENVLLDVMLKNTGNATATNIQLKLRSQDAFVSIQDSSESLGSLNVNDSVMINNAFSISVGAASNAHGIHFDLEVTDDARTINCGPILLVGTPVMSIDEVLVAQPPTMPGDTESISIRIANTGYGFGHSTYALLSESDPYVTITTDSIFFGEISPEATHTAGSFEVIFSSSIPPGHHPQLTLDIYADDYNTSEAMTILVGQTGFVDDMESGSGLWTTGGSNNQWHISTRKAYSPTHAWYCGDEGTGQYSRNMNCYIQTVPFMVEDNSILRFYRWFEVPIYGTDGIYVIIVTNSGNDTLDFVGTGGALKTDPIQSNWFEESYSLSSYPAGDTLQLRIAFISDSDFDVGEGFYIDDVIVEHVTPIEEFTQNGMKPISLEIYPNPFRNSAEIRCQITDDRSQIRIFDVTGRLVQQWDYQTIRLSDRISWDGKDKLNRSLPAGVYFVQLETEGQKIARKAILLR